MSAIHSTPKRCQIHLHILVSPTDISISGRHPHLTDEKTEACEVKSLVLDSITVKWQS